MNIAWSAAHQTILAFYRAVSRDDPSLYKFIIFAIRYQWQHVAGWGTVECQVFWVILVGCHGSVVSHSFEWYLSWQCGLKFICAQYSVEIVVSIKDWCPPFDKRKVIYYGTHTHRYKINRIIRMMVGLLWHWKSDVILTFFCNKIVIILFNQ